MTTTLVTGASGFVGRRVVGELVARGEAVRALVWDPPKAVQLQHRGVKVLVGNICDPQAMARAVRGVDMVHHCAAAVGGRYGERDFRAINVEGTRRVLEAAWRWGCRRVVLLSSLHVLGIGDLDAATEELPCRRTHDPAANAKIDMEQMALELAQAWGLEVVILRPGVIYGPNDPHNLPKLINALRRSRFLYLGGRQNVVPIVHVADVAEAMLLAARAPGAAGRVYHIADGSRTTIGQFMEHLADRIGCPRPRYLLPGPVLWPALALLGLVRRIYPRCPGPIPPEPLRFLATSRYVEIRRARGAGLRSAHGLPRGARRCRPERNGACPAGRGVCCGPLRAPRCATASARRCGRIGRVLGGTPARPRRPRGGSRKWRVWPGRHAHAAVPRRAPAQADCSIPLLGEDGLPRRSTGMGR